MRYYDILDPTAGNFSELSEICNTVVWVNQQQFSSSHIPGLDRFWAVIPAGGVGTRLWPLSRAAAPKFLHDLTGSGQTLIRATYDRLYPLAGENIMVVTGQAHHAAVCDQLAGVANENIILEPEPKDSAAAIGLAAAVLHERDPEAIMGSFAADQVIGPDETFRTAVAEAIATAATNKIVTIGIKPTYPSTGFGYIRQGEKLHVAAAPSAFEVDKFVEKPKEDVAQRYVVSGQHFWNAGMFVAPVKLLLQHLQENEPELFDGVTAIAQASPGEIQAEMERIWPGLPKTSIDYAVAEPAAETGDVAMIPGDFIWDDVGDFAAIARLNPAANESGVTVIGETPRVYADEASGVVVTDTSRVIALIGVEDIVVVDTGDALLVTTTEHAQSVKQAVESIKAHGDDDVL